MIAFPTFKGRVRVLRDTSWKAAAGFISKKTRSGVRRVRTAHRCEPVTFSVKMRFDTAEDYRTFRAWFEGPCRKGAMSFAFPEIDTVENGTKTMREYRFASDGAPQYSNPAGQMVDVTMTWEEV